MLRPFLLLQGLWKGSSTEQHTAKATETILAFKWTPAALVCLQLKAADSSGLELYWTVVCVLSAKSLLPCVEELGQGIIAVRPVCFRAIEAPVTRSATPTFMSPIILDFASGELHPACC